MAAIIGGALGSSIPNIFGGFAPFPNTIATALLAYQSEAIGFGFGIKFQYSKRLIGAMTNEEFNGLTVDAIGGIVEAHNTELIQRMADEMPKWLDIQQNFIEASVAIEIAKAKRTPSAWAEIIQAFSGGATEQIAASLDSLDPTALGALLAANPILALIYSFSKTGGGTTPPTTPPTPDPVALPIHDPDELPFHAITEHEEADEAVAIFNDRKLFKIIKVSFNELNGGASWTSPELNHAQHLTLLNSMVAASTLETFVTIIAKNVTTTGRLNLQFEYKKAIGQSFL